MTDAVYPSIVRARRHASVQNPFVAISDTAKLAVAIYFIFWRILPAVALLTAQGQVHAGHAIAIGLATCATEFLLLLPFLTRRFGGTPIGWLHPLILPTVVSAIFALMRNPGHLLTPVSVWLQEAPAPEHMLLQSWPDAWILQAQLKLNLLNILALACTYAGFRFRIWRFRSRSTAVKLSGIWLGGLFLLLLLIVFFFIERQGGLVAHMSSLAGGRFAMRELRGHFLVINQFLPYLLLLWYVYRPSALRSPLFVCAFIVAAVMQFVVTGSRSALFAPSAMLLAAWLFHHKKLPTLRAAALGLVVVLMIGVLGEVRRSGRDGEVDFTALLDFSVVAAWEQTQEELESRRRDTGLAVAALVPSHVGHLYGTTYLAAAAFWIPRSIWREKPRGGGAHAAALLFQGRSSMEGYSGAAFPISGVAEAYWNFGILGVAAIFLIYGAVLRTAVSWLLSDPGNPIALTYLIVVLFGLATPSSAVIVPFLQIVVLLVLISHLARAFGWLNRTAQARR